MVAHETVIGLEVHVQLATRTKLFCACPVDFGGAPNSRICPVCTGQPGVLPVLNREALRLAVRTALAVGGQVAARTKFDRKNYFYPDLPKGYQISQFDQPFCQGGRIEIEREDGSLAPAQLTRIHLEEDAGKAIHDDASGRTLVDLNRAGIPLIEVVGEPDLRSPGEAAAFLSALRRIVRHAGVSDGDMEKGSMRCDANVSLRPRGSGALGTKVEIKNMNSIRNVQRALEFEIERQRQVLAAGGTIVQETRSYRDDKNVTVSMRRKEAADDYRYFPEPDLPPFAIPRALVDEEREHLPESYRDRRRRLVQEFGLRDELAAVLCEERELAEWFEACVGHGAPAEAVAHWVTGDVLAYLAEKGTSISVLRLSPQGLAELARAVEDGVVSRQAGKSVLRRMLETGEDCARSIEALDLRQISNTSHLEATVRTVLEAQPRVVLDYRGGKKAALNALLGQTMKALAGRGNPQVIRAILLRLLDGEESD